MLGKLKRFLTWNSLIESFILVINRIILNNARIFFNNRPNTLRIVLLEKEKLEFVKTSVFWIEGRDIMDTCFTLNYGYEAPLPWPQVLSHNMCTLWISPDLMTFDKTKQVRMRLADDDSENGLQPVPGSQGMNVPTACTIVIIAGFILKHTQTRIER